MRRLRSLMLLSVASLMAVGLMAGAASAAVEVTDPDTGQPCPAVTVSGETASGGCPLDFNSYSIHVGNMTLGIMQGEECPGSFTARVDGDGDVFITDWTHFTFNNNYCRYHDECSGSDAAHDSLYEGHFAPASGGQVSLYIPDFCYYYWHHGEADNTSGSTPHFTVNTGSSGMGLVSGSNPLTPSVKQLDYTGTPVWPYLKGIYNSNDSVDIDVI